MWLVIALLGAVVVAYTTWACLCIASAADEWEEVLKDESEDFFK